MKKKRIAALLLLSAVCALFFASCKGISEEEILSVVPQRVNAALALNEIYFGKGLPLDENSGRTDGYRYVSLDAEYSNIEDIMEATEKVFTPGYCEILFEGAFIGYTDDNGNVVYPRYRTDDEGWLMIYEDYISFDMSRTYLFDTMKTDKISRKSFKVTIETLFDSKADAPVTLSFYLHEGEWLLDTPTY